MKDGNSNNGAWFVGRAGRLTYLVILLAIIAVFVFSATCRLRGSLPVSEYHIGLNGREVRPDLVPWRKPSAATKPVVVTQARTVSPSSVSSSTNGVPAATVGRMQDDAGPFDDIFIKLAERHRKLQNDILSGKVPLKRAIIAHCGREQVCAGQGDRTFGMLVLYLAAILTDRAFFIDYSKPLPMENYMEPNKLDWRISAIKDKTLQSKVAVCATSKEEVFKECSFKNILLPGAQCNYIMNMVFSGREFLVINSDHRTECVEKMLSMRNVMPPKGQHGFKGTPEDNRWWAANVSHIMSNWLYSFKENIAAAGRKALTPASSAAPIPPECLVCIHVRSGSGVGERARHTNWQDFANCAQAADADLTKAKLCPTAPTWLIVGDNSAAATEITKRITISKKPMVLSTNALGKPTHLDQNNAASNDMVAHVFIDWYILSQCRYMVASLSTFGATASIMGGPRVHRYDMEVAGHANGCSRHRISDWQRDANIPD